MSTIEISSSDYSDNSMEWSVDEDSASSIDDLTPIERTVVEGAPDIIDNIEIDINSDDEYISCAEHPAPMGFSSDFITMEVCGRHLQAKCKNNCINTGGAWLICHDAKINNRSYSMKYLCDRCLIFYSYKYQWDTCHNHGAGKQWHFRPRPINRTKNANSRI